MYWLVASGGQAWGRGWRWWWSRGTPSGALRRLPVPRDYRYRDLPVPGAGRLRHPAGAGHRALRRLERLGQGLEPEIEVGDRWALQVAGQPHELALQLP